MARCDSHHKHGLVYRCYSAEHPAECFCGGDQSKCDFFQEKRKQKGETKMATCMDCLHCEVCYLIEHYGADLTEEGMEYDCHQFQDRNKYEKVVRCNDCKHWKKCYSSLLGEVMCCTGQGSVYIQKTESDFCSCGERKDNG